ncbi:MULTISPECIES: alpha/beta fold hydrolase [unclassified Nocardioides]|uniref:alpha/beta fold hydrolase n=1 Tax=unclassified Nocardioides TaxID=2615069 RepID=UPI001910A2A5|nr:MULTISPECIES: alpha/beta fold hydrolase [unclassified Nocardioides]
MAPESAWFEPEHPTGRGALVVAGSSGRLDEQRARLLAGLGAVALTIRWFGGPGQQPGPFEVPLETFDRALDQLAERCERLAIVGTSFGAEAALLTAAYDERVSACVAFAPTPVVWAGYDGPRETSHWTRAGSAVPFVPFADDWSPDEDPPAYRSLYERSLAVHGDEVAGAVIEVERIRGDLVLVAGGDDRVWPSAWFADRIADRRRQHGLETTVVTHPAAGHRTVLPGERAVEAGQVMQRGGTPEADAALGDLCWPHVVRALA